MKKPLVILGLCCALPLLLVLLFSGAVFFEDSGEGKPVAETEETGKTGTGVGDRAPDFSVEDTDGKRIALDDLRGKVVVLTSTASWCPTCIIEAQEFAPVYREFSGGDVLFLSVSIDPTDNDEKLVQFQKDYDTPWAYTHPGRRGVRDLIVAYELTRFEITYVIDRGGVIRFKDRAITSRDKLRAVLAEVAKGEAQPELGTAYEDQGQQHIPDGASHPAYNSNPPTSGWHYERPAPWGIYETELLDEQLVHNLEHGGIWISHKAFISREDIDALRALGREYSSKVIVTVREENAAQIAVAAWGRFMELESFDRDLIVQFIERYKNQGPEFIPD